MAVRRVTATFHPQFDQRQPLAAVHWHPGRMFRCLASGGLRSRRELPVARQEEQMRRHLSGEDDTATMREGQ